MDNLRDEIFASDIIVRHKLKSAKALEQWLLEQNHSVGLKWKNDLSLQASVAASVWHKATTHEFFLGLDKSWLFTK
jgi:hypothetical protein